MKSKYAIFLNIKVTKIEHSMFFGTSGIDTKSPFFVFLPDMSNFYFVNPFRMKTPNIYSQEEINLYCIIKLAT